MSILYIACEATTEDGELRCFDLEDLPVGKEIRFLLEPYFMRGIPKTPTIFPSLITYFDQNSLDALVHSAKTTRAACLAYYNIASAGALWMQLMTLPFAIRYFPI